MEEPTQQPSGNSICQANSIETEAELDAAILAANEPHSPWGNFSMFKSRSIDRLIQLARHLKIRTKISCGYVIALGMAIVGTMGGILIGEFYHHQAREYEEDAREEIHALNRLQAKILQVQIHTALLDNKSPNQSDFSLECKHILKDITELRQLWLEFKQTEAYTKQAGIEELPGEIAKVNSILNTYPNVLESYLSQIEKLVKKIDSPTLNPNEFKSIQKQWSKLSEDALAFRVLSLSDEIIALTQWGYKEYDEAEERVRAAEVLRVWIIVIGIALSIAIATFISFYVSRVISEPIQAVTLAAQKVAEDKDFQRQVPVTTNDEIGTLTVSFNALIVRIAEYTRTLARKNHQLLQTQEELNQTLENLRQAQTQLVQTEKMSTLGHLIAGIAHEIKNPINFISNNLDYANEYTQELLELVQLYQQAFPDATTEIQDYTEEIEFAFLAEDMPKTLSSMKIGTDLICKLVLSLRNFSRLDETEVTPSNIHEGIESTLVILNHQLKYGIEVVKRYGNLPLVECYPSQLNQVFMNIIQNSIDALDTSQDKPNQQIIITTETIDSNQVQIRISDNGTGISQEDQNKIFEPFFTKKEVGKGTGLGLAICSQIIHKHQGKIAVNSQDNQGTEFIINLPIQQSAASVMATIG